MAESRGLIWDLVFDESGKVSGETRWNLTALVGMMPPPTLWLGQVGVDRNSFPKLNEIRQRMGQSPIIAVPMSAEWREFYQSIFIYQLLVRKTKPHSANKMTMPIRQLAPVAGDTPPWLITPDQIQQAYNATLEGQTSGKVALDFKTMVKTILDGLHLCDTPSLNRFCVPYPTKEASEAQERANATKARQNAHGGRDGLRKRLAERKSASKLPDERAFWELVRIVFTETPLSFNDAIRFAAYRVHIIMGFRIGETATIPLDWKRWRDYVDSKGRPAGERGGVSRSLMIRHFAEKQAESSTDKGMALYENTAHVPSMFQDILIETLEFVERITAPLRERLRQQVQTGRVFPEYPDDALIPAWEMYVRMTGNIAFSNTDMPADLVSRYRKDYSLDALSKIREYQLNGRHGLLTKFWNQPRQAIIPVRRRDGAPYTGRIDWRFAHIRVGDIEEHVRTNSFTKLSDTTRTLLTDGTAVHPHDLMFLVPIRNLIEGRNNGILDTTLYSAIGRTSSQELIDAVNNVGTNPSLFSRYGLTEEDRSLTLLSHSVRHLQTTELFRLGVADTLISKKFNRRSVAQSYEYDHRSLEEDIAFIDVPPEAESRLGHNARQVFKLIAANKAHGPIVDEFRSVQREYGDEAAFDYLEAEADGLHVTPYGLCVNSFTSDPCPKNLECFNGCVHLARTKVATEQAHLETLRDRFAKIIVKLEETPVNRRNMGWANQLSHARIRYENTCKAIATVPGEQVFPDGVDLSVLPRQQFGNTIIDSMKNLRDLDV
ncbi:hypothetical protein [Rhizobium leguminosarum]|uniref:hypothetical protein n=1 Tax=Rhizobium leguminosarum TaxID=384 RepID=UPI0019816CA8|nr:hypothetical protein [Rhizobium leguminosarum]